MSGWRFVIGARSCIVETDGHTCELPVGWEQLGDEVLRSDPPRPDELTNAIGTIVDHLDDVVRERPDAVAADWSIAGPLAEAIAAVEVGHEVTLPIALDRAAVEDVFRTLATESRDDRRHNPGLPAGLVDTIVSGCCVVVAAMRRLHLDRISIVDIGVGIDQDAAP